ncbi:MAG: hypothetical protein MI739_06690 [Bacteroidales bacterium]|nr:hypothetical protein [Bacteroidales bacterium]
MKFKVHVLSILAITSFACSSLQQTAIDDDLYYSPKDDIITVSETQKNLSFDKTNIQNLDFNKKAEAILNDNTKKNIDTVIYENKKTVNPYHDILVDDVSEAYKKRREGLSNPYYGMNNFHIYTSDAFWYASAYDPSFYNIVIMGDQVWVEPRWVSSSLGFWPRRAFVSSWNYPYYSCYNSSLYYNSWYSYGYGVHSPYSPYYSWNYPYYYDYYGYYDSKKYPRRSIHSYRQNSFASRHGVRSSSYHSSRRSSELPEIHTGRNINRSSTVKSGLSRNRPQSVSRTTRINQRSGNLTRTTISATNRSNNYTRNNRTSTSVSTNRSTNTRSSYRGNGYSNRTSRYSRPTSTSTRTRVSSSRENSTYSPRYRSSGSSRSTYRSNGSTRSSIRSNTSGYRPSTRSSTVRSSSPSRSTGSSRSSSSSSRSRR